MSAAVISEATYVEGGELAAGDSNAATRGPMAPGPVLELLEKTLESLEKSGPMESGNHAEFLGKHAQTGGE